MSIIDIPYILYDFGSIITQYKRRFMSTLLDVMNFSFLILKTCYLYHVYKTLQCIYLANNISAFSVIKYMFFFRNTHVAYMSRACLIGIILFRLCTQNG